MANNIKINEKFLKLKKNFKLMKKKVIGGIAIFTATTMLLTSCIGKKNISTYTNPGTTHNYTYSASYDNPLVNLDNQEYSIDAIRTPNSSYNEFINYLNNIKTVYSYENIYDIDSALKLYNNVKNYKPQHTNILLRDINAEELFSIVKNNNKIYLENKKKEYVADFYQEFENKELKKICNIIVDTVNYYIKAGKISDVEEVKCVLSNLKIFEKTTLTNAFVTDDNALMISPSMINTLKIKATKSDQDIFKDTISHEAIHMIQKSCSHTNGFYRIGNSFKFEELSINPLYWNWFYEGSAEMLSNSFTGDTPLVYPYYINYINSLSYSKILDDNTKINSLEQTTLSNDLSSIFNFFGADSETAKKEVIDMMFSLDIIETDNEDFLNKINLNSSSEEYIKIKRNLKTSVCETLSKYFYKSLASKVKSSNLKLNDIYFLITIFESDLDSHINYTTEEKYDDNKDFMKKYLDIQSNFFYYLSSDNKYTQTEIENLFDSYGILNSSRQTNYNLSFLNDEKQIFVEKMLDSFKMSRTEQVRDSYDKIEAKSK